MAHPRGGFASTVSRSNWNLEMLVFEEREDPEYPEKKPLGAETRTNNKLNPHLMLSPSIEPRPHWWEASTLPLHHQFSPSQDTGNLNSTKLQGPGEIQGFQ